MAIPVTRLQAIKDAFKRAWGRSIATWRTWNSDQAFHTIASELKQVFPPVTFGEGVASGTDTVSQVGDLYCDRLTGLFYQYTPGGWSAMAGGEGSYTLPAATALVRGGIKVGAGLSVAGDVLSADPYVLPAASAGTRGGIKVGAGLSVAGDVLSATSTGDMAKATYDTNNDGFVDEVALVSSALPTASSTYAGRFHYYGPGSGTEGNLYFCMRNSSGGYEWVIVGQSS